MARERTTVNDSWYLRRASGKSLVPSGLQGVLQYLCKQSACIEIQYWRGLTAPLEVRMVWWGFRALKTPERASSLPTLQRRRHSAQNQGKSGPDRVRFKDSYWTEPGQIQCEMSAVRGRNGGRSEDFHREA